MCLIVKFFEYKACIQHFWKILKLIEKRLIEQVKCLFDQLDEEVEASGEFNNSCVLVVKESDFLNLADMISF